MNNKKTPTKNSTLDVLEIADIRDNVVILRDPDDHESNLKRVAVTAKVLSEKGVDVEIVDIEGEDVFTKVFSSLLLGDWASYYLALSYGQDPTPVDMVENFKNLLK